MIIEISWRRQLAVHAQLIVVHLKRSYLLTRIVWTIINLKYSFYVFDSWVLYVCNPRHLLTMSLDSSFLRLWYFFLTNIFYSKWVHTYNQAMRDEQPYVWLLIGMPRTIIEPVLETDMYDDAPARITAVLSAPSRLCGPFYFITIIIIIILFILIWLFWFVRKDRVILLCVSNHIKLLLILF